MTYTTLVTAPDASLPMKEITFGHFVAQNRQRRWSGRATDETIRKWLSSRNLTQGSVSVFVLTKWGHDNHSYRQVEV